MDIEVGEVVRTGKDRSIGIVTEIRIIETAKCVKTFSGDDEKVMVRIRKPLGTALIWPKQHEIVKANEHDTKEYRSTFKQSIGGSHA